MPCSRKTRSNPSGHETGSRLTGTWCRCRRTINFPTDGSLMHEYSVWSGGVMPWVTSAGLIVPMILKSAICLSTTSTISVRNCGWCTTIRHSIILLCSSSAHAITTALRIAGRDLERTAVTPTLILITRTGLKGLIMISPEITYPSSLKTSLT